jgi:hypothetical protein
MVRLAGEPGIDIVPPQPGRLDFLPIALGFLALALLGFQAASFLGFPDLLVDFLKSLPGFLRLLLSLTLLLSFTYRPLPPFFRSRSSLGRPLLLRGFGFLRLLPCAISRSLFGLLLPSLLGFPLLGPLPLRFDRAGQCVALSLENLAFSRYAALDEAPHVAEESDLVEAGRRCVACRLLRGCQGCRLLRLGRFRLRHPRGGQQEALHVIKRRIVNVANTRSGDVLPLANFPIRLTVTINPAKDVAVTRRQLRDKLPHRNPVDQPGFKVMVNQLHRRLARRRR